MSEPKTLPPTNIDLSKMRPGDRFSALFAAHSRSVLIGFAVLLASLAFVGNRLYQEQVQNNEIISGRFAESIKLMQDCIGSIKQIQAGIATKSALGKSQIDEASGQLGVSVANCESALAIIKTYAAVADVGMTDGDFALIRSARADPVRADAPPPLDPANRIFKTYAAITAFVIVIALLLLSVGTIFYSTNPDRIAFSKDLVGKLVPFVTGVASATLVH